MSKTYCCQHQRCGESAQGPSNALLLVHPECRQEVVEQADYVGSTTGIMNYAKKSDCREFIIGTENSIVEHLQFDCPDKAFYPLAVPLTCMNMKITTLMDIYNCLKAGWRRNPAAGECY